MMPTTVCPFTAIELQRLTRYRIAYQVGCAWPVFDDQPTCNRLAWTRWRLLKLYRGGLRERGEWRR